MQTEQKSYASGMFTLVLVFFFWGFVAAGNNILIPVFKEKFHLQHWESQLVSFFYYLAYSVGALIYFFISKITGGDFLNKMGYRNGIALGLFISALGAATFYPAAQHSSFVLMLVGLFIIGVGFSLQQTAANPLAMMMGHASTGSQRLTLAGGINNLGTTFGPILISLALFGSVNHMGGFNPASIDAIKTPYILLAAVFIVVAFMFFISDLPNKFENKDDNEQTTVQTDRTKTSALSFPQVILGMIAIFLYVGVEVSTVSNLPEYMHRELKIDTGTIAPYISLFWAGLMIGRWTGAIGAFDMNKGMKGVLRFAIPYIAFYIFLLINKFVNYDITPFFIYAAIVFVLIIADLLSYGKPARQLLIFSCLGIIALLVGIYTSGLVSVFAFISVGLFCSTLWPCIFTLGIAGLGKFTNQGSSFLIMMILGGGVISLFQGYLADYYLGIKYSYFVGVACFLYLAFYSLRVSGILRKQGISI